LAAFSVLTVALAAGLPRVRIESDGASLYPHRGSRAVAFDDPPLIIVVARAVGQASFETTEGLAYLKALHESARELPFARRDRVESLVNVPVIPAGREGLALAGALDELPRDPTAAQVLLRSLHQRPRVSGLFLSRDGSVAALYIGLRADCDRGAALAGLDAWLSERSNRSFQLSAAGPAALEAALGRSIIADLAVMIPVSVIVMAVLLAALLRSAGGVLATLAVVAVVLIWVFGLMGWLGTPVTMVTTILPVLLVADSIPNQVRILHRVQHLLVANPGNVASACRQALAQIGRPVALSSGTTALGCLSFVTAPVLSLRIFGLYSALGMIVGLLFSFTLVPALLVTIPASFLRPRSIRPPAAPRLTDPRVGWSVAGRAAMVVAFVVLCAFGLGHLVIQDSWSANFPGSAPLVRAERAYNKSFWGSYFIDVDLRSASEGYFLGREGLALVSAIQAEGARQESVGGVLSHAAILEEIAAWRGPFPGWGEILEDRLAETVGIARFASEALALERFVSPDGRQALVRIFVPNADHRAGARLLSRLERAVQAPQGVDVQWGGTLVMAMDMVDTVVVNQVQSLVGTLLSVGLLLAMFERSFLVAVVLCIPPVLATALGYAVAGAVGWNLGIATSLAAAPAISVGVDFAIHLWRGYRDRRQAGQDHQLALAWASASTIDGQRSSCLVLGAGYIVLALSAFPPSRILGVLLAAITVTALGTTLLVLPHLLQGIDRAAGPRR
jgi:predicted RND superfamily exporter protein